MSLQIGSLNCALSFRSNLQVHDSFITISDLTFPRTQLISNSPSIDIASDDSNHVIFNTISNFNNSELEQPDEFLDSELSPTNIYQATFQPINPPTPVENSTFTSSKTDATPILSPLSSNVPDVPSPIIDEQLKHDLDDFITHQQQIHNTNSPFPFIN